MVGCEVFDNLYMSCYHSAAAKTVSYSTGEDHAQCMDICSSDYQVDDLGYVIRSTLRQQQSSETDYGRVWSQLRERIEYRKQRDQADLMLHAQPRWEVYLFRYYWLTIEMNLALDLGPLR